MVTLSIIIPVYNIETYIEKCIHSLEDQDIPKETYEIIIVNDGSTDRSAALINGLMNEYGNIVYIDQVNQGVSAARNAGIEIASGNYLLFIDGDDYVAPNSFARVLKTAADHEAQIVYLGYTILNEDYTVRKEVLTSKEKDKVYNGLDAYKMFRQPGETDPDHSWAILFESALVKKNQLRFLLNVPYLEDGEFIARIFCLAEKCVADGHPFYFRTTRAGSATTSGVFFTDKASEGFILAATNLKKFQKDVILSQQQKDFLNRPIVKFTLLVVQSYVAEKRYAQYIKIKSRLKSGATDKLNLAGCSGLYYKYGLIYNLSSDLFYHVWSIRMLLISLNHKLSMLINKNNHNIIFLK